ncbi:hypothetical protein CTA2_12938 [Colletotrichum tanaceti]|uniref:Uncharacterized protein n=1 Tax=Colletotrichum tanaceti TaxID=1306861 RepID=A0A4U6X466_9PEZI|nr:hypothetical protein CTA2_12938 [Colletotrichum tanaceti]TKW49965.1 hypothetical protein CTA1_2081 [Colletotrichum tanaceti]
MRYVPHSSTGSFGTFLLPESLATDLTVCFLTPILIVCLRTPGLFSLQQIEYHAEGGAPYLRQQAIGTDDEHCENGSDVLPVCVAGLVRGNIAWRLVRPRFNGHSNYEYTSCMHGLTFFAFVTRASFSRTQRTFFWVLGAYIIGKQVQRYMYCLVLTIISFSFSGFLQLLTISVQPDLHRYRHLPTPRCALRLLPQTRVSGTSGLFAPFHFLFSFLFIFFLILFSSSLFCFTFAHLNFLLPLSLSSFSRKIFISRSVFPPIIPSIPRQSIAARSWEATRFDRAQQHVPASGSLRHPDSFDERARRFAGGTQKGRGARQCNSCFSHRCRVMIHQPRRPTVSCLSLSPVHQLTT